MEMEDSKSAMYQHVVAISILDRFARRFASNLKAFKGVHRVEEEVIKLLVEQAG